MTFASLSPAVVLMMTLNSAPAVTPTTANAFELPPATIFLLLAASSDRTVDIASLVPPEDYFRTRNIDPTAPKLMELALNDPVDSRTSIQQLLALRVLAEAPSKIKEGAGYLKILEEIAAGKKAQDELGFSREYAAWAVASATKKPAANPDGRLAATRPLTQTTLGWFPDDVSMVLALEAGGPNPRLGQTSQVRELIEMIVKEVSVNDRKKFYDVVDQLGNIRIERISMGISAEKPANLYWRFSGKGNHKALVDQIRMAVNQDPERGKGPRNEALSIFPGKNGMSLAIIGDGEFIVGLADDRNAVDNSALIKKMLAVRAGDKASVLKSKFGSEIAKVSDKASAFIVGTFVPPELVREFGLADGAFNDLPKSYLFEAVRQTDGIDFRFQGKLANADSVKAFIEGALKVHGQAMIKLKTEPNVRFPVEGILKTLASMKFDAKEDRVNITMRVTNEVIGTYLNVFLKLIREEQGRN